MEGLYSGDDVTTKKIAEALNELSDALKGEKMFWKQRKSSPLTKKRR